MANQELLSLIDAEIARLKEARSLLANSSSVTSAPLMRGRQSKAEAGVLKIKKKRHMTPEGRARIAEAVKKRWAAQKKKAVR
jgi:hypothetical protein